MDILSSFKLENQRSYIVYLLPGTLALWPYSIMIYNYFKVQYGMNDSSIIVLSFLYLLLSLGVGSLLDDIGSRIELIYIDKRVAKIHYNGDTQFNSDEERIKKFRVIWNKYLTIQTENTNIPILIKYYRYVLMRLKFEINISVGLILMLIGQIILQVMVGYHLLLLLSAIYTIAIILIILYLLYEAIKGAELLHDLRIRLLEYYKMDNI